MSEQLPSIPPLSPTKSDIGGNNDTVPKARRFPRRRTQSMSTAGMRDSLLDYDVFASVRVGSFSAWDIEDRRETSLFQQADTSESSPTDELDHLRNIEMSVMFAPE